MIVRALSSVSRCAKLGLCKHGCDITRTLVGYVLSGVRFLWLVVNMSASKIYLDQEVNKHHLSNGFRKIF